jgi:hypothetical protein
MLTMPQPPRIDLPGAGRAALSRRFLRVHDQGANALLQSREPVNKFPDFVRYIVQRPKTRNPAWARSRFLRRFAGLDYILG